MKRRCENSTPYPVGKVAREICNALLALTHSFPRSAVDRNTVENGNDSPGLLRRMIYPRLDFRRSTLRGSDNHSTGADGNAAFKARVLAIRAAGSAWSVRTEQREKVPRYVGQENSRCSMGISGQ